MYKIALDAIPHHRHTQNEDTVVLQIVPLHIDLIKRELIKASSVPKKFKGPLIVK